MILLPWYRHKKKKGQRFSLSKLEYLDCCTILVSPSCSIIDLPTSFITQEHHKTIPTALLEAALVGPAVLPCLSALANPQVGSHESTVVLGSNKGRFKPKTKSPKLTKSESYQVYVYVSKRNFHDPKSRAGYEISLTSFLPGITFRMILFNSDQRHLKKRQAGSKSTQCPEEHIRRAGHSWDVLQSTNWSPCQMIGKLQSLAKIVTTVHSEINHSTTAGPLGQP